MNRTWKSSMMDVKTYPGADCDTNHVLLVTKTRAKTSCTKQKRRPGKLNVKLLNDPTIKAKFQHETEKWFQSEATNRNTLNANRPESLWTYYKTIWTQTAEQTIGRAKRAPQKPWISQKYMI